MAIQVGCRDRELVRRDVMGMSPQVPVLIRRQHGGDADFRDDKCVTKQRARTRDDETVETCWW